MEPISTLIPMGKVEQLRTLLSITIKSEQSSSQKYVYDEIGKIELEPSTYTAFAYIFKNDENSSLQKIAGISLKATLKRNIKQLQFSQNEIQYLRETILRFSTFQQPELEKIQNSLIGLIATFNKSLDYKIISYLLDELKAEEPTRQLRSLETLAMIFEDLRFEAENFDLFQTPDFINFTKIFIQYFALRIKEWNPQICEQSLKCMNLLIPQLGYQLEIISSYCTKYLMPILQMQNTPSQIIGEVIEGLEQIMETNSAIIINDIGALKIIFFFFNENQQTKKKWMNLILDIIQSEIDDKIMKDFLNVLFPKIVTGLIFTEEDQKNLKVSMEEEVNPYTYDDEEDLSNDMTKNCNGGYTLRRLSVMSFERLIMSYTDEVWEISKNVIGQGFNSSNLLERECCSLISGLVCENIQDYFQDLKLLFPSLYNHALQKENPQILRCTSLWAIEKMSGTIAKYPQLKQQAKNLVYGIIGGQNSLVVKQSAYSTLGELIDRCEIFPEQLPELVNCILFGLKTCDRTSIISILKIISDLYGKEGLKVDDSYTQSIIKNLCGKWLQFQQIQSVCCRVIQCLVTVTSTFPETLNSYAEQIFKHCLTFLKDHEKRQILLRVIDLLSSLVGLNLPTIKNFIATNQQFHSLTCQLVASDDKQIKHFGYGLLGDFSKSVRFPSFVEQYICFILSNFDKKNITTSSNALTCLTDLILAHPEFAEKYAGKVMELATNQLTISHLQSIYLFNFARIYGRLGTVRPQDGALFLANCLKPTCLGLRAHEYQKLTDQAFKGLFMIVLQSPQAAIEKFEYLVDSFICYPCKDQQTEGLFFGILREFRRSLSTEGWSGFLDKPIFLPATVKKIEKLSVE